MNDRRGTKQRGLDMFFKRRKRDQKEASDEEKDTKDELKDEPKEEPKDEPEDEGIKVQEDLEQEIKPPTHNDMLRKFLQTREAPFTIRMLTRETDLTLNDAKTAIQTLLSTEELATHTVGKTPVYCKTSRFVVLNIAQTTSDGATTYIQEENRKLLEKVTILEQENRTLSKKYEALQTQHAEIKSKSVEPADELAPHLQERISALEQANKQLTQEKEALNAQIVNFQSQLEKIATLEQENRALSKKYEDLQTQHAEMGSKMTEPSDKPNSHLQERISALEQANKQLTQEKEMLNAQIISFQSQFGGKETEWKTVAMLMAEEMATRANTSTEDVLRYFEAPGYY